MTKKPDGSLPISRLCCFCTEPLKPVISETAARRDTRYEVPAKVIGLCQVKGGAGRSTVATNLAGELSKKTSVALIDCDMPQGTSASWAAMRAQAKPPDSLTVITAKDYRDLIAKLERARENNRIVILDGPPRIAEIIRAILLASDLTLIPIGASVAEIWATGDLLPIITEVKKIKRPTIRLVWTRFRAYTKLAQELSEQASKELDGIKALEATLGFRVSYPDALGQGLTVSEMRDPAAKEEMDSLVAEVEQLLKRS